ncbi:hypothetical protein RKE29_26425 [Streptomyces sp. B1866]|uniref:SCO6745 family protein n=1 Tax=Streptomyces sp. B1866 TaxID=3075431 RepID=UPI0028900D53|nr:hypothetical protein [Streptomyces sp. B1866]MDT3400117.1 hypothetical protein [Streptomyces sp. B1866]
MTTLPERAGRRCHAVLNPIHSTVFFTPELPAEFAALGLRDPAAQYFAARSAPLGRVGAATVTATFYNFKHELIARYIPAAWDVVSPEEALAARLRAADALLRRLLGEEAVESKEMAEAADLALRATEACTPSARPLYAANAALPVPDAPHLAYWYAATLLREHRGDGHLAVLLAAGLDGLEAQATHTASGKGMSPQWVLRTRGWTEPEWEAARERLRERGLLDAEGELTAEGVELRRHLEDETDRLDRAPYEHLGEAGVARLTELAGGFTAAVLAAGGFPADLIGKR